jgi:endonuclease/exonuclease/phosphatase family metal-dependent hydrolase
LSSGTFWLSETPDVVGSKGWDAKYPRICTWGQFKDLKSGKKFWMFNLHLDHKGVEARRQSCHLVLEKVKQMCGKQPFILMGDFNVDQTNEIYNILADSGVLFDSYETAAVRFAETGSMNHFKPNYKTDLRIDHVFLSSHFKALDYALLTYSYWTEVEPNVHEQRLPSDHYPVGVHVEF